MGNSKLTDTYSAMVRQAKFVQRLAAKVARVSDDLANAEAALEAMRIAAGLPEGK